MTSGIYCIENIFNGKKYIGMSINIENRMYNHMSSLRHDKHTNTYLQKSYNKYGANNFHHFLVEEITDVDKLKQMEIYWICFYDSYVNESGYNLTRGGDGLLNPSQSTVQKMVENGKKLAGVNNPFYGKLHSEESKNKMRISHLKPEVSIASRNRMLELKKHIPPPMLGKKHSEESLKKMSEAHKGKTHVVSEESKLKSSLSKANQKRPGFSSSNHVGIDFNKKLCKWCARTRYQKKRIYLGYFNTELEAIMAYEDKYLELFGTGGQDDSRV